VEIRLDRDVNALYIRLRAGKVSRTVELTDSVYVDMDDQDAPLGIEFINADEFVPFLREHADDETIPPRVRELFRVTAA
jgi:uncharacterized protein YuzE